MIEMPILRPVPIPLEIIAAMENKDLSLWERIKAWRKTNRKWEVMEDWHYDNNIMITIEKGFVFDGASIPKPLWWLLSPVGLLLFQGYFTIMVIAITTAFGNVAVAKIENFGIGCSACSLTT